MARVYIHLMAGPPTAGLLSGMPQHHIGELFWRTDCDAALIIYRRDEISTTALRDVNIDIAPGRKVAICGRTGRSE